MLEQATAIRFAINGLFATAVHYLVLVALIEVVGLRSAGLANGMAAIVGIAVSYLGNRSLVFRSDATHRVALPRFLAVYTCVAIIHAAGLTVWTDMLHLPYQAGFLIATGLSAVVTYLANRLYVFRRG